MRVLFRVAVGLALLAAARPAGAAEPEPEIRRADGRPATFEAVTAAIAAADVAYLGEEHDDAAAHRLQLAWLTAACEAAGDRPVALALEMFERDVQPVLDEYMAGLVREQDLLSDARPWPNYTRDYRPLVAFARARGLPVIAANAPKRYVSRVGRLGPDSLAALGEPARRWLAPGPVPSASVPYAAKFRAVMGPDSGHAAGPGLLAAQVLRDATMADSIASHLAAHPGALVVMINGQFHSAGRLGIPEHLARRCPGARQLVVTMTRQDGPDAPTGDFVVRTGPRP